MAGFQGVFARAVDVALIVGGGALASRIRFEELADAHSPAAFIAFAAAFALAVLPAFDIYESWRGRSTLHHAGQLLLAWLVVQACGVALMFVLHQTVLISRLWFAYWTVITGAALIASRVISHLVLARLRNAGLNLRRVAVVGFGGRSDQVLRNIEASSGSGFRACARFDLRDAGSAAGHAMLPAFSDLDAFVQYVRTEHVEEVWLALPLSEERVIARVVNEFRDDLVNIRFIPDVSDMTLFDSSMIELIGVPAINLMASPLPLHAKLKKELFDRCFAAVALLALSPLLLALAVAVKLSSPGPVLFTQLRKGADGRVFRIFKFRSMRVHREEPGVVRQATRNDSRITRVGAFLRRTSLDELPQFFNVLLGDMSVVGPRPHAIEHDELYRKIVDGYIHRYRIKPGITGWAQVNGYRGETDQLEKMQGRVEHDLYYLRNWSFALDMRIVLATIAKGFMHRNAY
jgi:Undecaprenyl-phosphate glucose phosphotransferase